MPEFDHPAWLITYQPPLLEPLRRMVAVYKSATLSGDWIAM
jgi:hypothetical protein